MATKDDLIDVIMLDTGIKTKATAEKVFDSMIQAIIGGLQTDGEVQISMGKFKKVHRSARMGRNPQTGESLEIPAKTVVKFYASKSMKVDIQDPELDALEEAQD